jgi:hypothetical protein
MTMPLSTVSIVNQDSATGSDMVPPFARASIAAVAYNAKELLPAGGSL